MPRTAPDTVPEHISDTEFGDRNCALDRFLRGRNDKSGAPDFGHQFRAHFGHTFGHIAPICWAPAWARSGGHCAAYGHGQRMDSLASEFPPLGKSLVATANAATPSEPSVPGSPCSSMFQGHLTRSLDFHSMQALSVQSAHQRQSLTCSTGILAQRFFCELSLCMGLGGA